MLRDAVAMPRLLAEFFNVVVELGLLRALISAALATPLNGTNGRVGHSFKEPQWALMFLTLKTSEVRPPTEPLLSTLTSPPPTASSSSPRPSSTANEQQA